MPQPPTSGLLSLTDRLAAERTALANERTLLAYVRTALALLAGGVTLLHFFEQGTARAAGLALLPLGLLVLLVGGLRFLRVRRRLRTWTRP